MLLLDAQLDRVARSGRMRRSSRRLGRPPARARAEQLERAGQERPAPRRRRLAAAPRAGCRRTTPPGPRPRARAVLLAGRGPGSPSTMSTRRAPVVGEQLRRARRRGWPPWSARAGRRAARAASSQRRNSVERRAPPRPARRRRAAVASCSASAVDVGEQRRGDVLRQRAPGARCGCGRYAEQLPSGSPAWRSTARWVSPREALRRRSRARAASSSCRRRGLSGVARLGVAWRARHDVLRRAVTGDTTARTCVSACCRRTFYIRRNSTNVERNHHDFELITPSSSSPSPSWSLAAVVGRARPRSPSSAPCSSPTAASAWPATSRSATYYRGFALTS